MTTLGSRPKIRPLVWKIIGVVLFGLPAISWGQSAEDIDAQFFTPSSTQSFFGVANGTTLPHLGLRFGAFLHFADDPLVVFLREDGDLILKPVQVQTALDVTAAIGLWNFGELGVSVPVALLQNGEDLALVGGGQAIQGGKFGDIRLSYKQRLLGTPLEENTFKLSLLGQVKLPTGSGENFFGSAGVPFLLGIATTVPLKRFSLGGNIGFSSHPPVTIGDITISNEIRFGAGGSYPIKENLLALAEVEGALSLDPGSPGHVPTEARLGARIGVGNGFWIPIGAGIGLNKGIGAPDFRILTGILYEPKSPDPDGDGLLRANDLCPLTPEDQDDFQDDDGCPEPDNDGDNILDVDDNCVDLAEDFDNFQDKDGCPEPDNDGDNILDIDDNCPDQAETFQSPLDQINGEDTDGCPDEGAILRKDKIELREKIYFDFGKASLQERSFIILNEVATLLQENPQIRKVRIEGHTDDVDEEAFNQKLSEDRANTVREYLIAQGIAPERLESIGFGETRHIESIEGKFGVELDVAREKNRRVEFLIIE